MSERNIHLMDTSLFLLPEGETGVVEEIFLPWETRRRLLDLGLTPGARVACLFSAPSGDPRAYMVRGSVIALRREDADRVALCRG